MFIAKAIDSTTGFHWWDKEAAEFLGRILIVYIIKNAFLMFLMPIQWVVDRVKSKSASSGKKSNPNKETPSRPFPWVDILYFLGMITFWGVCAGFIFLKESNQPKSKKDNNREWEKAEPLWLQNFIFLPLTKTLWDIMCTMMASQWQPGSFVEHSTIGIIFMDIQYMLLIAYATKVLELNNYFVIFCFIYIGTLACGVFIAFTFIKVLTTYFEGKSNCLQIVFYPAVLGTLVLFAVWMTVTFSVKADDIGEKTANLRYMLMIVLFCYTGIQVFFSACLILKRKIAPEA
jgi:hypothetical protein